MVRHPEGHEYVAANGYTYVKLNGVHRLKHHLIAEERLGRAIDTSRERVVFEDNDRTNFADDNITVKEKKGGRNKRIDTLKARINRDIDELYDLGVVGVIEYRERERARKG